MQSVGVFRVSELGKKNKIAFDVFPANSVTV